MVRVQEAVRLDKVCLFRWNEKFLETKLSESEGLALFVISSKFGIAHDHNSSKTIHRRCKIVVPFNLSDLLVKNKNLGLNLAKETYQFLSRVVPNLGEQISNYLFTRFQFDSDFLLRQNSPKTVIVIEVSHERMIQGLDEDDDGGKVQVSSIVPPDRPPHYRCRFLMSAADDDSDDDDDDDDEDNDENEGNSEDKEERQDKDEIDTEYLLGLKDYLVEDHGTWQKSRPIARDEPRGFVEVLPIRLGKRKREFDKTVDKCSICLDGFLDADEDQILTTTCLHVFHSHCISNWLVKNNSCPSCRLLLPML